MHAKRMNLRYCAASQHLANKASNGRGWLGHEKMKKSTTLVRWTVNGKESRYRYRPVMPNGIFIP